VFPGATVNPYLGPFTTPPVNDIPLPPNPYTAPYTAPAPANPQ
jgi:hypothetical protein